MAELQYFEYNVQHHDPKLRSLELDPIDQEEAVAMSGLDPWNAIKMSLDLSQSAFVIMQGDRLVGVFGLIRALTTRNTTVYSPWAMLSPELRVSNKKEILWVSREVIAQWEPLGPLVNYVSTKNIRSIKWLTHMGFTVHTKQSFSFFGPTKFFMFSRNTQTKLTKGADK